MGKATSAGRKYSAQERLDRLAIVLKVEIRRKIVSELYGRAMSPKGFFEAFGGGSLERVAQHFAVLEEHAWLERVGHKKAGEKRRGPPETLYRTTELPFLDVETWSLVPYSVRLAFSRDGLEMAAKDLRRELEETASKGRPVGNFDCTQVHVDGIGWERTIARLAEDFHAVFEEQRDAEARTARSSGELVRAGILRLAFESPRVDGWDSPCLAESVSEPPISYTVRAAPVFADELSMRIVAQLNREECSVRQFHRTFASDVSEGAVRYRFERLKDLAWIAMTRRVTKRGAPERLYRATRPPQPNLYLDEAPDSLRRMKGWKTFTRLSALVEDAFLAGTFDAREDRHLSWSLVNLDAEGWRNAKRRSNELAAFVRAEQDRAQARIAKGAEPLTMVVGLAAIRQPQVGVSRAP